MKERNSFLNCITLMLPIALILSGIFPIAGRAKDSNLESFGDVMQIALLAAGLVIATIGMQLALNGIRNFFQLGG